MGRVPWEYPSCFCVTHLRLSPFPPSTDGSIREREGLSLSAWLLRVRLDGGVQREGEPENMQCSRLSWRLNERRRATNHRHQLMLSGEEREGERGRERGWRKTKSRPPFLPPTNVPQLLSLALSLQDPRRRREGKRVA